MFFNKTTAQIANEQRLKEVNDLNFFTRLCNRFSPFAFFALYQLGIDRERKRIQSENKSIRDQETSRWVGQNVIAIVNSKYPVIGRVERLENFSSDIQYPRETFLVVRDYITGEMTILSTRKVFALNHVTLMMFIQFPCHQIYNALVNGDGTIVDDESEFESHLRISHIENRLTAAGQTKYTDHQRK